MVSSFQKQKLSVFISCQIRQLHLDPHLTIYGSPISVVSQAKFLGLLFDNKSSFIPHIKALKAKCLKALDILKIGLRIHSYGSAIKFYLKSLDTIHHQGLRLAL